MIKNSTILLHFPTVILLIYTSFSAVSKGGIIMEDDSGTVPCQKYLEESLWVNIKFYQLGPQQTYGSGHLCMAYLH